MIVFEGGPLDKAKDYRWASGGTVIARWLDEDRGYELLRADRTPLREAKVRFTLIALEDSGACIEAHEMRAIASDPDEVLDEILDSDDYESFDMAHEGRIGTTIEWLGQQVSCVHKLPGERHQSSR